MTVSRGRSWRPKTLPRLLPGFITRVDHAGVTTCGKPVLSGMLIYTAPYAGIDELFAHAWEWASTSVHIWLSGTPFTCHTSYLAFWNSFYLSHSVPALLG